MLHKINCCYKYNESFLEFCYALYSNGKIVDLHFKSAVEGVIIKWATQITEVLSADSASAFKNNQHLTPWAGTENRIFKLNNNII